MDFTCARQAIYNSDEEVIGFELLYRSTSLNRCPPVNGDAATLDLLSRVLINDGIMQATDGKLAFVNYTHNLILEKVPLITPRESAVVEILEDVRAEHRIFEACRVLSERGYTIVLDDFIYRRELEPLVLLADIIKIDFRSENEGKIEKNVSKLRPYKAKLLAEKVETEQEYEIASRIGFDYFQGNFFSPPEMVPTGSLAHLPGSDGPGRDGTDQPQTWPAMPAGNLVSSSGGPAGYLENRSGDLRCRTAINFGSAGHRRSCPQYVQ